MLPFCHFCLYKGFYHRTESDLFFLFSFKYPCRLSGEFGGSFSPQHDGALHKYSTLWKGFLNDRISTLRVLTVLQIVFQSWQKNTNAFVYTVLYALRNEPSISCVRLMDNSPCLRLIHREWWSNYIEYYFWHLSLLFGKCCHVFIPCSVKMPAIYKRFSKCVKLKTIPPCVHTPHAWNIWLISNHLK